MKILILILLSAVSVYAQSGKNFQARVAVTNSLASGASGDITTGLVGHWPLDEGTGTTAEDATANNNDGTLFNTPTWIAGQVGAGALSFVATEEVTYADDADLQLTGALTISAWVKRTAAFGGAATIIGKDYFHIRSVTGTTLEFRIREDGGTYLSTTSYTLPLNTWVQLIGTYDGSETIKLYADNVEVGTATSSGFGTLANVSDAIGINKGGGLDIDVDDFRIYNRKLTADDMVALP